MEQTKVPEDLKLEKAMQEIMDNNDTTAYAARDLEFRKALINFQSECPTLLKKKSSSKAPFPYAPLEEIMNKIQHLLTKNRLFVTHQHEHSDKTIFVRTSVTHENGHKIESSIPFELAVETGANFNASGQAAKALGMFSTYFKRYNLTALLNLVADQDLDEVATEDRKKTERTMTQKQWKTLYNNNMDILQSKLKNNDAYFTHEQIKKMLKGVDSYEKAAVELQKMNVNFQSRCVDIIRQLTEIRDAEEKALAASK